MRNLSCFPLLVCAALVLSGCGSDSPAGSEELGLLNPGGGGSAVPVVLSVKGGSGFACFVIARPAGGESLFCAGTSAPLSLASASPVEQARTSSSFSAFEVWDDTVCVSTSVSMRPISRLPGSALYCWGEASLGANYSAYDMAYSPPYSTAGNGSPELTYATDPFVGADESMDVMTNTGGTWLVMMDGSSSVTSGTISCSLDAGILTCASPSFTLDLN